MVLLHILLAFAFTDLLPEAVELGLDAWLVGQILLAAIVVFFLLEKAALWHHDHHHELGKHTHPPQVTMIVLGDGCSASNTRRVTTRNVPSWRRCAR